MAETTAIEWADATINLWWGCTKVSPGCANCYAATLAARFGQGWGPGVPRTRKVGAEALARRLNRKAERTGQRIRVFSASMSDWLDPAVPLAWVGDLLALIASTPRLTWMLLTKRPELWEARMNEVVELGGFMDGTGEHAGAEFAYDWRCHGPPANVWMGATVEDQQRADERIPALLSIPARVRFLSCEPLLRPLDLSRAVYDRGDAIDRAMNGPMAPNEGQAASMVPPCGIHWIIVGGESGHAARPTHPAWVRSLRDQAQAAGAAFFFKQWGEWRPKLEAIAGGPEPVCRGSGWGTLQASGEWFPTTTPWNGREDGDSLDDGEVTMVLAGKKAAGRVLDGRTWDEVPT